MQEPDEIRIHNRNVDSYYWLELDVSGSEKQRVIISDPMEMVFVYREQIDGVITYLQYMKKYWEDADAG